MNNYQIQQSKDIEYGSYYERMLKKTLSEKHDIELKQYTDTKAIHDFYINDKEGNIIGLVELKTRRIKVNQYDSLMLGFNKIEEGRRRVKLEGIKFIVYVWCLDGKCDKEFYYWIETLDKKQNEYYIEYNGNRSRGDSDKKLAMIYTDCLKEIKELKKDLIIHDFL
tara:strand:- start:13696 stop:14193 length:498 start_codon:yes stop_codon:yes gene_type:complete